MAKDQVRFDVDAELKHQFQLKCTNDRVKMTSVLVRFMEEWVSGEAESQREAIRSFLISLIQGQRPSNAAIVHVAGILKISTDQLLDFCDRVQRAEEKENGSHSGSG